MEAVTMMYCYGSGMNGWGYAFMMIILLVFCAVVIVGAVALVRYLGRDGQRSPAPPQPPPSPSPERLLGERFARGEIDEEEYRRRLAVLRGADSAV
jgi:putative membrane protein